MNAPLLSLALAAAVGTPLSVSFLGGGGGGSARAGACDTKVLVSDCGKVSIACCAKQGACDPSASAGTSELSELAYVGDLPDVEGLEDLEAELEGLMELGYLEDGSDELEALEEALEAELEQALEEFEREMEALEEQMEEAFEAEEEAREEAEEAAEEGDYGISYWRPESVQELARLESLYAPLAQAAAPLAAALQQSGGQDEVEAQMQALEALLAGQAKATEEVRVQVAQQVEQAVHKAREELHAAHTAHAGSQAAHADAALKGLMAQETAAHQAHKALLDAHGAGAAAAPRTHVLGGQSGKVLWVSEGGEINTLELEGDGPHAIYVDEDGAHAVKVDGHQVWTGADGKGIKVKAPKVKAPKAKDSKDKSKKKVRTLLAPPAPDAPETPLVITTQDGTALTLRPGYVYPGGGGAVTPAPVAPLLRTPAAGGDELAELKDLLEEMHGELRELRSSVQDLRDELRELQTR